MMIYRKKLGRNNIAKVACSDCFLLYNRKNNMIQIIVKLTDQQKKTYLLSWQSITLYQCYYIKCVADLYTSLYYV